MATKILNHYIAQSATQRTPILGVLFNISMAHVQLIRDFDYWPLNKEEKSSLSNDYGDGNENDKKVMGFYKEKKKLCTYHVFCTFVSCRCTTPT